MGSYTSEGGALEGLVETEAGGQWSAHTAVLAGLRPEAGADPHLLFKDLACPHAGYCAALATYEDTGHQAHDFLEVFSDGKWSAVQAPLGDIAPAPAPGAAAHLHLDSLSCWAAARCMAVGSYDDAAGAARGLAETNFGRGWQVGPLPVKGLTPGPGADSGVTLDSVQCPSPGNCIAVGTYRDARREVIGMSQVFSGGKWSARALPIGGLVPAPAGTVTTVPTKLSCPTAHFCVAVGTYRDLYGDVQGFSETFNAGKWTAWTLPTYSLSPPAKLKSIFTINAVACPSAGQCTATGYYGGFSNENHGFVEELSGGLWTALTVPLDGLDPLAGGFPGSQLDALGCAPSGYCVAVGSYSAASGLLRGLAEIGA